MHSRTHLPSDPAPFFSAEKSLLLWLCVCVCVCVCLCVRFGVCFVCVCVLCAFFFFFFFFLCLLCVLVFFCDFFFCFFVCSFVFVCGVIFVSPGLPLRWTSAGPSSARPPKNVALFVHLSAENFVRRGSRPWPRTTATIARGDPQRKMKERNLRWKRGKTLNLRPSTLRAPTLQAPTLRAPPFAPLALRFSTLRSPLMSETCCFCEGNLFFWRGNPE